MFGFGQKRKDKKLVKAVQRMNPSDFLHALQEGADVSKAAEALAGLFEHNADAASVMVEWSLPYGLDVQAPLYSATPEDVEQMELTDADDYPLQTIFNTAAAFNVQWIVKAMIEHGADICHRDSFGRTPVFEAINNNSFETAYALVDKGGLFLLPQYTFCIAQALNNPQVPRDLIEKIITHPDIKLHLEAGGRDGSLGQNLSLYDVIEKREDGAELLALMRAVIKPKKPAPAATLSAPMPAPVSTPAPAPAPVSNPAPPRLDGFRKLTDYSIETDDGGGLSTVFNFKTGQFIVRENGRALGAPQSFSVITHKETVREAYDALVALKGCPPAY